MGTKTGVWAVVVCLAATGAANALVMETVPIGNPGNAADTRYATPGYGAVDYSYNIGKYEVTAGQYCEFLTAVAATDTYGLYNIGMGDADSGCGIHQQGDSGSYTYTIDAAFANRPVAYISWGDAARFANWLHNGQPTGAQDLNTTEDGAYYLNGATTSEALLAVTRKPGYQWAITNENEWYKAAYYNPTTGTYYDYPTGSNETPGRDLSDVSGNNANVWGYPYPIDSPYYTTTVGEFQNSHSPYGTFDQGGNVWEWNESVLYGVYRGIRGGSFSFADRVFCGSGVMLASYRSTNDPASDAGLIGFRVVQVPEPTTIVLAALAGLAIMRKKNA